MAVCTNFSTFEAFFCPIALATATLAPIETPINRLMIKLVNDPVEPTAANDWSPQN